MWRFAERRRRMLLGLGVLGLGAGWALFARGPAPRETRIARREDLVLSVEVEGELAAVRAVEIGPPPVSEWELKIAFLVPEGAAVRRGEPVIGFDTQALQRSLDERRAELLEQSRKIEQKQLDLDSRVALLDEQIARAEEEAGKARLKADVPEEVMGRVEARKARLDSEGKERSLLNVRAEQAATRALAESELRSLLGQRQRAAERVAELEAAIARMTVKAPQDGVVIYRTGWRGEKKKVGDTVWRGEALLAVPDLTEMKAVGDVDEADGGQVSVGQPVTLRLEARPDLDIRGTVRALGTTVRRKSWRLPTKVYKVQVGLERTDPQLMRPAMRFRGEIEVGRVGPVLAVPSDAIFLRARGPVAWVERRAGFAEVPVRLGRRNARLVEVLAGVEEGDVVSMVDLAPASRPTQATRAGS